MKPHPQDGEVRLNTVDLDHVVCSKCYHLGLRTTLCGADVTPMRVIDMAEVVPLPECVVCHAAPTMTCNSCGEEIQTCP